MELVARLLDVTEYDLFWYRVLYKFRGSGTPYDIINFTVTSNFQVAFCKQNDSILHHKLCLNIVKKTGFVASSNEILMLSIWLSYFSDITKSNFGSWTAKSGPEL